MYTIGVAAIPVGISVLIETSKRIYINRAYYGTLIGLQQTVSVSGSYLNHCCQLIVSF